ncbi:MAG: hypothetical protein CMF55_04500 [Legionellales bacterium]|nr:hypothetical protein [Legionellales bacterium]HAG61636.1 hypothetical protein [Coxiellaceae bacterium]
MNRSFLLLSGALLFTNHAAAESLRGITLDQNRCPQARNDDDNAVWAKWHHQQLVIIGLLRDNNGIVTEYSQPSEFSCLPALDNTHPSVHNEGSTYIPLKEFYYTSYDPDTHACNYVMRCFNEQRKRLTLTPTKDQDLSQQNQDNHLVITR